MASSVRGSIVDSPRRREELQHHRRRELRGGAEAAVGRVVLPRQRAPARLRQHLLGDRARGHGRSPAQVLAQLRGHPLHLAGLVRPGVGQRLEHLPEARLPVPRPVREVGAGEERAAVVVEDARHRPPALPGHRGGRVHVDRIDVRPLLAVDLDADEVLVEVRRRGRVLERLVGHHVAPVAGGVPDAQQHRHLSPPRLLERRRRPLPPVDGVVRVLEEVRRRRVLQAVGHPPMVTDLRWAVRPDVIL